MTALFHVTYLHAIPSIMEHGLQPGSGGKFGSGYAQHSKGRIFLAEPEGVWFWMMRLGNEASNLTDHPEEGWVPVTLFVDLDPRRVELHDDVLGTRDSRAPAYYSTEPIPPEQIFYLDGDEWRPIEEADPERMMSEVLDASVYNEEEDFWEIDDEYFLLTEAELRSAEEIFQ